MIITPTPRPGDDGSLLSTDQPSGGPSIPRGEVQPLLLQAERPFEFISLDLWKLVRFPASWTIEEICATITIFLSEMKHKRGTKTTRGSEFCKPHELVKFKAYEYAGSL